MNLLDCTASRSVRVPEFDVLPIGHVVERLDVSVVLVHRFHLDVAALVSPHHDPSKDEDIEDEQDVDADVDVEGVDVSRGPVRHEQLRSDRIPASPGDNCGVSRALGRGEEGAYRTRRR